MNPRPDVNPSCTPRSCLSPDEVPVPSMHPGCWCILTSDDPEPFKALAAQLIS
jgi:hypothetical protein